MGEEKTEMFGRFFHRLITEHSYYELLYKSGIRIKNNTYIANKSGNTPIEVLGLSKTQWKMVTQYKVPLDNFANINNNVADQKLINYLSYIKSLEEEFGVDKIIEFVNNEKNYIYGQYVYRSALSLAERYNLPVKHFLRYIYFECDVSQGLSASSAVGEYADYIRMTSEMGYERFDRYPRFLRTAHDIASRNYRMKLK
jgi:hypothetical protein